MKKNNIYDYIILLIVFFVLSTTIYFCIKNISNSNKNLNSTQSNIYENSKSKNEVEAEEKNKPTIKYIPFSSYETEIIDSQGNRIKNLKIGAKNLDEYVIKKDAIFSFNDAIGKITAENGYVKAIAFNSNGKEYLEIGGGICQLSSTIYNAALNGNLEIIERHPHSKRVNYVPKDKDATIYQYSKDLKFRNNTSFDLLISTYCDENTVKIDLLKVEVT